MMCTQLHRFETNIVIKGKSLWELYNAGEQPNWLCLNFHVVRDVATAVTLTFLFCSDPFTLCSIWVRVVKCLMLPFLHPPISMPSSLRPFLFLLITSPLIYDRTWEYCFQVLICISVTPSSSLASWFPFFPPSLSALWSVLCGFFVHLRTETHPDPYRSAVWNLHNGRCLANNIYHTFFSLYQSALYPIRDVRMYAFHMISVSYPSGKKPGWTAIYQKKRKVLGNRDCLKITKTCECICCTQTPRDHL